MSPSFDISNLLCDEEEDFSIFSDEESLELSETNPSRLSDSISGFPIHSDGFVLLMVEKEIDHFPKTGYFIRFINGDLDLLSRVQAVDWISKVIAHYNFGPLCAYLAVSYLDRFLSTYNPPKDQVWMMQLLVVACLSLAAKMEENDVPLSLDLQVAESKFLFEAKTIQRMELVVLSTLKWRMQAITPFSYIDYFLYKINGEKLPPQSAITQSTQLILGIIRGIEFLEYRPSEIAAAVAISVSLETQTVEVDKSLHLLIEYTQKDKVLKCMEMISESSVRKELSEGQSGDLATSVPHSPIDVLDTACLSYLSDESPVGSCANSPYHSHGTKRRKLLL